MPTVLVLSCAEDETATMVVEQLRRHPVDVVEFDTADFPLRAELVAMPGSGSYGILKTSHGVVDLDTVVGVLYRRPAQFHLPEAMLDAHRRFARAEALHGFGGVVVGIDARWVNHPTAVGKANFKPWQLNIAAAVGMNVPQTIITNSTNEAQKFSSEIGKTLIYKVFEPPLLPDQRVIYTSVVDPDHLNDPAIGLTAHLFQEQIDKEFDARITVIADRCFAVGN